MKKHLSTILLVTALLLGAGLMLYPTASNYWNSFHQSQAIAGYAQKVSELSTVDYERIWLDAQEYNRALSTRTIPFSLNEEELEAYNSQLNLSGDGVMGYIEIPKIEVTLPIYHGTSDAVLQVAAGHIDSSSLPVGGESSHCVISGHRGLPSAKLFTDLDRLNEGDIFELQVLKETLTYEVDQIHIVLPGEMQDLAITKGQDYCTLVTCTPYGINSHRLLVRGRRIDNPEQASGARVTADAVRIDPVLVAPVAALPMLLVMALWIIINPGARRSKRRKKLQKSRKNIEKPCPPSE